MSDASQEERAKERSSVLAELPRTRPQRTSSRRKTARMQANAPKTKAKATSPSGNAKRASASAKRGTSAPTGISAAKSAAAPKGRPKTSSKSRSKQAAAMPPAAPPSTPRQGYEAEQEIAGTPVTPPTSTELVGAVAELAGELAQTGIAAGGKLLKGALSRLTRS